jgi:hypothetical protein
MNKIADIIKNPSRLVPREQQPYIPEYVQRGLEPEIFGTIDHSGVDEMVIDDEGESNLGAVSGHMIDNNDYVDFGFESKLQNQSTHKEPTIKNLATKLPTSKIPETNEYILMVFGKIVLSGAGPIIENKVKAIIYGEDKEFNDLNVNIDDIVILKRMPIKIGVFIGE